MSTETKAHAIPELDWTSDDWTPQEREVMLRWYMDAHGTGDTSLARFAPFMIRYDPVGFKRYRRHVRHHGRTVPGSLLFTHTYAANGVGDNCLYQVVSSRQRGFTKAQVIETLSYAYLTAGPAMNAAAASLSAFLYAWQDDGKASTYEWPSDWRTDPKGFRSGIDHQTDEFSATDIEALSAWHKRMTGTTPRYVRAWAKLNGPAYKTNRIRWEGTFGTTLPLQLFPLFTLHLATFRVWPEAVLAALKHARTLGLRRSHVADTLESAFTCGGEAMMAGVLTDEVIDVLETFPE